MREFTLGPFKYAHVRDVVSIDGRDMRAWELSYEGRVLACETIRRSARNSTIIEVFDHKRIAFTEQLMQARQPGDLEFSWVARLLPVDVLSQDARTWKAPTRSHLAHVVGIGSLTGVTGEQAAQLIGISAQNFRKYTAGNSAKHHVAIPFSAWHLLLQRLNVQSFAASHQQTALHGKEAVASVALRTSMELVEEVNQYLKRFPPVPVTRQFIARLDLHLRDAETIAARNLAQQTEEEHSVRQQKRQAISLSTAGIEVIKVCVQGDTVKLNFALDRIEDHDEQFRKIYKREVLMQLYRGLELKLQAS